MTFLTLQAKITSSFPSKDLTNRIQKNPGATCAGVIFFSIEHSLASLDKARMPIGMHCFELISLLLFVNLQSKESQYHLLTKPFVANTTTN